VWNGKVEQEPVYKLLLYAGPEVTEGDRITGTLTAVEVSHDMDESDYVFEASTAESGSEANRMKEIARKQLAAKLRPIFQQLPKVLSYCLARCTSLELFILHRK